MPQVAWISGSGTTFDRLHNIDIFHRCASPIDSVSSVHNNQMANIAEKSFTHGYDVQILLVQFI